MNCLNEIKFKGEKNTSKINYAKTKENQKRLFIHNLPQKESQLPYQHLVGLQRQEGGGNALWGKTRFKYAFFGSCWYVQSGGRLTRSEASCGIVWGTSWP